MNAQRLTQSGCTVTHCDRRLFRYGAGVSPAAQAGASGKQASGGVRNSFTFLDTPSAAFARQHGLRVTSSGLLQLLDNLGDPSASRAERYLVDADAHAVRLVDVHAATPAAQALLGGTTQELPDGRSLVAYGNGNRVEEYDGSGVVVWRIEGNPVTYSGRSESGRCTRPGVGTPR